MKQKLILILLVACITLAGCSNSSVMDNGNNGETIEQTASEDIDALFEYMLPGPVLMTDEVPEDTICTEYINQGLLRICYVDDTEVKLKLQVLQGDNTIVYNLKGDGSIEDFPLQYGDGEYTARIMQNINDDEYFAVETKTFTVTLANDKDVYLNSVQNINWDYDMAAIHDVRYIVADSLINNEEDLLFSCMEDLYQYIIENIKYDDAKANELRYDYLPDIEQTYSDGKGICYDCSALFAAMLRSINVPAKLVKGYASYNPDVYHAWNEVYIDDEWIVIDITRDATLAGKGTEFDMEKNSIDYTKVYEY